MMGIIILTRRLKKDKTYEDFRKAWYHTVGYGVPVRLYSAINAFDQREIIVVALGEVKPGQDPTKLIQTEVKERLEHPLEAVIEPEVGRTFGIVVSEDDFSPTGKMEYRPASINGKETDFKEITQGLEVARELFTRAEAEREAARTSRRKTATKPTSKTAA
jgi:hypothetical protein